MLYRLFYIRFFVSTDQRKNTVQQRFYQKFERDFYMKIIVTVIPTNFVIRLLPSIFSPFIENKNKDQVFSKLLVL